jgi:tetratricopeptide (TPR) repeat protein
MKFKFLYCFIIFPVIIIAQNRSEGEVYFNNKQYTKALSVYESLLKKRPNDGLYNFRYARCCYELKEFDNAIIHFEKAGPKFPMRNMYLGEIYFNLYRFEESVSAYQSYISTLSPNDKKIVDYQEKVMRAENAARLIKRVEDIAIVDSMAVNKKDFLRFYKFNSELGSLNQESLKMNARRTFDKIKYTTQRQDRVYFSDSIHGQMDIFTSFKLLDSWSKPVSISDSINTKANENYPFVLLDGVTLYFASDGENSIGGYDIFITRYNPSTGSYLAPENMGMPFNSPFNDYMMVIDEQRKIGWFASDRYQPAGKVMIYKFIPNEIKTIVPTEKNEYLKLAAQLKTYRKVTNIKTDSTSKAQNQLPESEKHIEFIVNDSIIYTNVNQFKSDEARKQWIEVHKLLIDMNNKTKELSELRAKYANSENELEQKTLSPKIMELEKNNVEMLKIISLKTNLVRNEEINFLQKKK